MNARLLAAVTAAAMVGVALGGTLQSAVPPADQLTLYAGAGFLAGGIVGSLLTLLVVARRTVRTAHLGKKENDVDTETPSRHYPRPPAWWPRWEAWSRRHGVALQTIVSVVVLLLAGGLFLNNLADQERDRARAEDNSRLLKCFDQYTNANAPALAKRSEATATRDEVLAKREESVARWTIALRGVVIGEDGLGGLITRAQQGVEDDPKKTLDALAATFDRFRIADRQLAQANTRLRAANEALDKVRDENPLPPPPSKFCELND